MFTTLYSASTESIPFCEVCQQDNADHSVAHDDLQAKGLTYWTSDGSVRWVVMEG